METETLIQHSLPKIYGLGSCSEAADNIFAPSIFLFGCNLRCPYCMNAKLVVAQDKDDLIDEIPFEKVKKTLLESESDWVMISGGEPLLTDPDKLRALMVEIKSWGKLIGLSTNGLLNGPLTNTIALVDYVTMDLKSGFNDDYIDMFRKNIGSPFSLLDGPYQRGSELISNITLSQEILRQEKVKRPTFQYEYRTTLYPEFVHEDSIREMGKMINRDERWVFQQFRHAKSMIDKERAELYEPYNIKDVELYIELANKYVDDVSFRYV